MRKFGISLLVLAAISALLPSETMGGPFGRFGRRSNWTSSSASSNYTYNNSSNYTSDSTTATHPATYTSYSTTATPVTPGSSSQPSNATAQGVAELMARAGWVGHFGGNPGYEGCGCGSTPEAAYNMCSFANSGMATVDVGYAQGSNGMWYCCRRYR